MERIERITGLRLEKVNGRGYTLIDEYDIDEQSDAEWMDLFPRESDPMPNVDRGSYDAVVVLEDDLRALERELAELRLAAKEAKGAKWLNFI